MASVPPTPLMPSRYTAGWDMEDESLLMDQQPIFGDESMLNMTFEMGTEDGDDGDVSSGTIVAADLDGRKFKEEENLEKDEDGECEVARDAQANLGYMDLPTFHNESQDDINTLQDLDPFDYPPSPFLNRSTYHANQQNVDVGSPTQVRQEEDIREETTFTSQMKIVDPAQIGTAPANPSLSMQSESLELMPDKTTFSARGEKSTWAEEERDSSLGPGGSSTSSSIASGSGKRPASSPRRAAVTKKSRPQSQHPRSPSRDDFFSRRLSRSTSSSSTRRDCENGPSNEEARRPSFGRDTQAGPSRPSPSSGVTIAREASPAIRSSMEMSNQEQDDIPPTPLPPPTLLSRLIAKSTVLHPRLSASDAPPTILPNRRSFADHSAPLENVIALKGPLPSLEMNSSPASTRTAVESDFEASSTKADGIPLVDDGIERPRRALTPCPDEPSWPNGPAGDLLEISQRSFQDCSFAQRSEEPPNLVAESSIISTTSGWPRRSTSRGEVIDEDNEISSIDSLRPPASLSASTSSDTVESSLRRSTSQRVIGFFSSILRSSTSSKSISDLGKSASFKSDSVVGEDISLRLKEVQEQSSMDDLRSEDHQEQQSGYQTGGEPMDAMMDISRSSYRSQSSSSSYPTFTHYSEPIPGIPPLPKYIPLTRPTKAFVSHTASRIDNPIRQPKPKAATSTFASTALARLPPPGKGSSASGQKVVVKPVERASNLQARRALFEKSTNQPVRPETLGAKKTIPVKESILVRPESRSRSDQGVNNRWEEKKRLREMEEKRKREKEDKELREKRKETVVRARPVPEMYRRKA